MRTLVAAAVACSILVSLSQAQNSEASIRRAVSIPAQDLSTALQEFAQERKLYLVYDDSDVAKQRTAGAAGEMTGEEMLAKLLEGTGLTYRYLDEKTVMVVPVATALTMKTKEGEEETTGKGKEAQKEAGFWGRFRLAQLDQATPPNFPSVGGAHQGSDQNAAKLDEVVVTAQKREERLLDVPISIVALSSDELQNRKLTSLSDLQFAVPGMAITTDGVNNTIELRGVSNSVIAAPLVGVYLDEADVTNSGGIQINANTYDLERVEVLRGPQGTLYGEGSAGGTIRFITKNPVLDRFGMTANVASLFTQGGSPSERINTAINVPLIDHELGVRIVGTFDREGGWIDQPAASRKDINGQDLTNVRIKSLWQPSPQFSASFMAEMYRDGRSTGINDDAGGNFTQPFNLATAPAVSEDHDIYNLTLSYDFPVVKILSATSYLREKVEAKDTGYSVTYPGSQGTPPSTYDFLSPYALSNDHAWVEELRLSSAGSAPWQWTVGGIYRHYRDVNDQPSGYYGLQDEPFPASYGAFLTDTLFKSWSVFGDVNYNMWERFTLGFGVRSFHESQDVIQVQDYGAGPTQTDQTGRFHSVDPRVYAQYQLSRNINMYTSAAKGFRSGGFNSNPDHPTFDPENVRTYELGTKMSLFEGRLHAETAVFYTDYEDYVVSGFAKVGDFLPALLNVGTARIKGVEWDFVWRPSDEWSLGINGDYYDTRFTKVNTAPNPVTGLPSSAYAVGDSLDSVPKYQMTSSAQRDFAWDGKQVSMRLDYTRRGRMTFRNRSLGLYSESDVTNLLGYYMQLHWSKNLSFNLFAQNLLNDRGLVVPVIGGTVRSRPRTYGIGFDLAFE